MRRPLPSAEELVTKLRFDDLGLLPVVARSELTGQVLMLAWSNREAVERTLATGEAHFWSRSRGELWRKGATSGNVLHVVAVEADCDGDALLLDVHPDGPACHSGATSCFGAGRGGLDLGALERIVAERRDADPATSYTARLFREGRGRQAQKVGEEATEVVVAALLADGAGGVAGRSRLVEEAADLLYHLAVLLASCGVEAREVAAELGVRHRAKSGEVPEERR